VVLRLVQEAEGFDVLIASIDEEHGKEPAK
jgi:hypothetical protein